jgi:nucleoside-diphosphate-sugar epimerase
VITAALSHDDTVAVIGATGNVGRLLVTELLAESPCRVRALVRSPRRAQDAFPNADADRLLIDSVNVAARNEDANLARALAGAKAVAIMTGTSAYPSKKWGPWFQNSPDQVDRLGTLRILNNLDKDTTKRVIYISSAGTMRPSQFPFPILNVFGVLDAKRAGEISVVRAAKRDGYQYAIVRPGQLFDVPNASSASLSPRDRTRVGKQAIRIAPGDQLQGEVSRSSVARLIRRILEWDQEKDLDFCLVNENGIPPSTDAWNEMLANVSTG